MSKQKKEPELIIDETVKAGMEAIKILKVLLEYKSKADAAEAEVKRIMEAIAAERNAELFEDGLAADLRQEGVKTVTDAFARGRQDFYEALTVRIKREP